MKKYFAAVAALLMMLGQGAYAASHQPQLGSGARVDEVDPNGAAAQAGIRPGDIIRVIGKMPINGYPDIDPALSAGGGKRPLNVIVDRGGQNLQLKVTPQADPAGQRLTLGISQLGEAPVENRRWALVNWMMERNSNPEPQSGSPTQMPQTQQEGPHDLWHIFLGPDK